MSTVDADVLQAQYFIAELESAADTLVQQIQHLETLVGARHEVARRRGELYDVRRQIDAMRRRFVTQI
ncbi:hypothetical protein [Williamsia sp. M5A3_1d]